MVGGVLAGAADVAGRDAHVYDSGVRGAITVSGRCPAREGPQPPESCTAVPFKATVRVLKACSRREVLRFTSRKKDGRFHVPLKPGRYILDPLNRNHAFYHGKPHIQVRKHRFVRRNIHYYYDQS